MAANRGQNTINFFLLGLRLVKAQTQYIQSLVACGIEVGGCLGSLPITVAAMFEKFETVVKLVDFH